MHKQNKNLGETNEIDKVMIFLLILLGSIIIMISSPLYLIYWLIT